MEKLSHHADCRAVLASQYDPAAWDDPRRCNCDIVIAREAADIGLWLENRKRAAAYEEILVF